MGKRLEIVALKTALFASVSAVTLILSLSNALAASDNSGGSIGTIDVQATTDPNAVGSKAAPGTAAAMAPSQSNLQAVEPGSTVSDKVIQDIATPAADYNEPLKFTPNFVTTNSDGFLGDTKASWRGFQDGQYNITFDGVPFGDMNDPTHHSNAYFPGAFIGSMTIDRGPGQADQFGYATFGGTLAMHSYDLSDTFGGAVSGSYGTWNTWTATTTVQSGLLDKDGTKLLFQYDHEQTDGALTDANVRSDYGLLKLQHQFGDFTMTGFSSVGRENYNNANAITMAQLNLYGKNYGELNNNPNSQEYTGYNNSVKQTDMEYLELKGGEYGWNVTNKLYTYSYWYPALQNNGQDQTYESGPDPLATTLTISPTKKDWFITQGYAPATGTTTITYPIGANDVTGYLKDNNYRAYGDMLKVTKDVSAGLASGQLNVGAWYEYGDNQRLQEWYDYTTNQLYSAMTPVVKNSIAGVIANPSQALLNAGAYKLNLNSKIFNFQPYAEYHWQPTSQLTITPGVKYESFTRDHDALVNQTTLLPASFNSTYNAALPYLDVRYRLLPDLTIYAQASEGFLAPTVSAYYVTSLANSDIAPEQTVNLQAGAVYKNAKYSIDGDVYQITASNFPVSSTLSDGSTTYYNAGTARYQGVEGEGAYVIQKGLSLYASGAASSAKYISGPNSGLGVGDAPSFTFAGGLVYDDQHWFGSMLYKVNGPMFGSNGECGVGVSAAVAATCVTAGAEALNKVPSYNETDLVVGYKTEAISKWMGFFKKAEIRLGVNNVFDNRNVVEIAGDPTATGPVTLGGPNVAGGALTYAFQPGRMIYTQVKLDF